MVTTTNARALGWKHNNEPGIRTRNGIITNWPTALGPMPSQAQVNTWEIEYQAFLDDGANDPETTAEDIIEALKAKGVITDADIISAKQRPTRPPRRIR